jgi:hypothetical protein
MRMVTGRTVAAGLVSAVVLLGAACSEDGDGGNPLAGADETASQSGAGEQGSGSGGEHEGDGSGGTGGSGSGSGGGSPDSGGGRDAEALASSESQLAAAPNDEDVLVPLTLEVTRLVRSGDLVELEVRLVNDSEEGGPIFEPWDTFAASTAGDYTISGLGLVDPDGQRMYLPAWDSADRCVCSGDLLNVDVPPGESYLLTASIGGVPEDVGPVDLHFPGFPVITGLEIEG